MANKLPKKGKHPGAVDTWLDGLGFYRKNVAYDETCLFRAVCEQLFGCQVYHERVRKECIEYAREHYEEFAYEFNCVEDFFDHMEKLEKHMIICSELEIQIVSRKYQRDVMVFDSSKHQLKDLTMRNLPECLLLCLMGEDHYDVVYKKDHIITAGFCQSVVYRILYENVYKIPNVLDIVNGMLYDKTYMRVQSDVNSTEREACFSEELDFNNPLLINEEYDEKTEIAGTSSTEPNSSTPTAQPSSIAPFPFKVAKALDPAIYRNIEYDSWIEVRRELRLGEWYYGDDKLILGTRCLYKDTKYDISYECYIQNILKDHNKCVIYITKLAERRTVPYSNLSPEDNAKPWPLPYRFSKNLVLAIPNDQNTTEKSTKSPKKKKDKRRTQSCSEVAVQSLTTTVESVEHDIKAFVGAPLWSKVKIRQVSNSIHSRNTKFFKADIRPKFDYTRNTNRKQMQNQCTAEESSTSQPAMSQDPRLAGTQYLVNPQWNNYVPSTVEQLAWPQTPSTPQAVFSCNMKPMVASAPVTPDVIPYHEVSYPYCYNYPVDPYHGFNWVSGNEYQVVPQQTPEMNPKDQKGTELMQNSNSLEQKNASTSDQTLVERPMVCTTLTPTSPQVEVYSPIIPIHPGTPIVYASHPHPEMTEVIMSSTPMTMYTSPVDNVYVTPTHYMYPPTPPTAWYPPGITSQGFIFPTQVPTQNVSK